jgi:uncharacterized repeat protein (TIGR01451 family)
MMLRRVQGGNLMTVVGDEVALHLALSVVVISIVLALVLFATMPIIPSAVEAQGPPLTVSKSASPDPVVAGEELTYIITITNTGREPWTGVVMTDVVPRHTTFVLVSGRGGDWWMQTPSSLGRGEILWKLDGSLAPGEVSHLRFVVRTEMTNAEPIVSQGCRVMAEGWDAIVSEAVTTQVLLPTPTPTLLHTPVPPTPTSLPTLASPTITPSPTLVPPTVRPSPTFSPTSQKNNAAQTSSFGSPFGWAGLLIGLIVVAAALIPFSMRLVKKRGAAR